MGMPEGDWNTVSSKKPRKGRCRLPLRPKAFFLWTGYCPWKAWGHFPCWSHYKSKGPSFLLPSFPPPHAAPSSLVLEFHFLDSFNQYVFIQRHHRRKPGIQSRAILAPCPWAAGDLIGAGNGRHLPSNPNTRDRSSLRQE